MNDQTNREIISEEAALAQWEALEREYDLPPVEGLPVAMAAIRKELLWKMRLGRAEVLSDSEKGVVIRQHLRHVVRGVKTTDGRQFVDYRAPTSGHIARGGIGRDQQASTTAYTKVAAALTGLDEGVIGNFEGGDHTLKETIVQFFILA